MAIGDAYYQRLIQGDQFDVARKAFQLLLQESDNPAIKGFSASRLNRLNMIGKPAPAIQGTDLDGKPVNLDDLKGNVVLVVFWASWCLPSSAEVASVDQAYSSYQGRGLRVLGINLDTMQNERPKLETVMPNIRRFLLDNNVRRPNLVNGTGAQDYAKAYGVTDIPSNVLIGRDGTVVHMDLCRRILSPSSRGPSGGKAGTVAELARVPDADLGSLATSATGGIPSAVRLKMKAWRRAELAVR